MNQLLVKASGYEIAVNVVASVVLAHFFGIVGVAYGTIVACTFEKAYLAFHLKKKLNISIDQYVPTTQLLTYSGVIAVVFVVVEFILY